VDFRQWTILTKRRAFAAVVAALALGSIAGPAAAEPWVEPGDPQLRQDIELLVAYGIVDGPLNRWPVPWSQISAGFNDRGNEAYPAHVERAIRRVQRRMPQASDYRGLGFAAEAQTASEERLVRGFSGGARQEGDVSVSLDKHWATTYAKLSLGWREDQSGSDIHFDSSYIAQAWGNWVFYGGTLPQWWGGGWDGGLMISTNARPFPRVGLQRLNPKPFETPWLSWLGNWNIQLSAGRLDDDREDFDNPLALQMRVTISPIQGLDLSASRFIQICGDGRPCDLDTFSDAIFPFGGADNTGLRATDPSDQQSGLDLRYSNHIGGVHFATFAEMLFEDLGSTTPTKASADIGLTLGGYWPSRQLDWHFRFEASDTEADNLFGLEVTTASEGVDGKVPGVTFNSFIFTDGNTFRDRTIGHSLDTDSRLITVEGRLRDRKNRAYWLRYRRAVVNVNGIPGPPEARGNVVSDNREEIDLVETGASLPTRFGPLRLELRLMDDQPNTPGRSDFEAQFEAGFQINF